MTIEDTYLPRVDYLPGRCPLVPKERRSPLAAEAALE